ncbi:Alpha/Beta hydrolase protein [Lentinula raphanica]|uniref:Alpha/Beta hydrolase protein n=1 Tax=Lentinula raphanica TaxID=153919 RepID=A0AA38UK75_9AGAR|nr:Alpha/Beta hydrolase protein [Lentinula raphanica]KAJ3967931.1 Alpha/Beta hydrolase protein [Lentinula raphanica]
MSSSTSHTMTEKWVTGPQETQFYTRTYAPSSSSPRALIVFVHGFQEHIGRYAHIHPSFAENGLALWTYDQRGYGRTALDKEHRSKNSSWGKTGWSDQLQDVNWAVRTARSEFPGLPTFLMGHSMGGGEVLSFVTEHHDSSPQYAETVASLAGVIVTSPLIQQTVPASKALRWLGGKVTMVSPYTLIPAAVKATDLSHSPEFNDAYIQDPLIKSTGSLRGIGEMLSEGEKLSSTGCHHWPRNMPILFIHGDADKVTSVKATQAFFDTIDAQDKQIIIFPDGYHELQNEPPEVRQKLVNDIVSFVEARTVTALTESHSATVTQLDSTTNNKNGGPSPHPTMLKPKPSSELGQDARRVSPRL